MLHFNFNIHTHTHSLHGQAIAQITLLIDISQRDYTIMNCRSCVVIAVGIIYIVIVICLSLLPTWLIMELSDFTKICTGTRAKDTKITWSK